MHAINQTENKSTTEAAHPSLGKAGNPETTLQEDERICTSCGRITSNAFESETGHIFCEVCEYPEWVVVEKAGEDDEDIYSDHYSFKAAKDALRDTGGRENGFDIMKRLLDGKLTTEF